MPVPVAATRFDVESPQEKGARTEPVPFRIEAGVIRKEAVIQNDASRKLAKVVLIELKQVPDCLLFYRLGRVDSQPDSQCRPHWIQV
jgi:hypothetical protein